MKIWQKTDRGVIRKENQDSCGVLECGGWNAAVVCDGMGGARAGAVASALAVETFVNALRDHLAEETPAEQITEIGLSAVDLANGAVYEKAMADENCRGMGTTLVSAVCRGAKATIFNVGDSRAYLINPSGIRAISRDHSLVQDMLERGDITAEEARTHPNRNLITRALGTEKTVCCDTFHLTLEAGDYILLCSDGLVNTVSDQEMLYEVVHEADKETCLDRMMEIAIDRGAPDNVTMVLMEYMKEAEQ